MASLLNWENAIEKEKFGVSSVSKDGHREASVAGEKNRPITDAELWVGGFGKGWEILLRMCQRPLCDPGQPLARLGVGDFISPWLVFVRL